MLHYSYDNEQIPSVNLASVYPKLVQLNPRHPLGKRPWDCKIRSHFRRLSPKAVVMKYEITLGLQVQSKFRLKRMMVRWLSTICLCPDHKIGYPKPTRTANTAHFRRVSSKTCDGYRLKRVMLRWLSIQTTDGATVDDYPP